MPSSASATPEIYTLSLHDALPISARGRVGGGELQRHLLARRHPGAVGPGAHRGLAQQDLGAAVVRVEHDRGERLADAVAQQDGLDRSEEHTSELQSRLHLVCRLLLPRPPRSTLFPYTTLFRSLRVAGSAAASCSATSWPAAIPAPSARARTAGSRSRTLAPPSSASSTTAVNVSPTRSRSRTASTDRKSTRLNSSHGYISYAVFCFRDPRDLHSFPTRRSSDLCAWPGRRRRVAAPPPGPPPSRRRRPGRAPRARAAGPWRRRRPRRARPR